MKLKVIKLPSDKLYIVRNNNFEYMIFVLADTVENKKKYGIPTLPIIYDPEIIKEEVEENVMPHFLQNKLVSLTFDDGPTKYTNELLKILERNHSRATFFILGNNIRGNEDMIRDIRSHGNEIGIHGYSHKAFTNMSVEDVDAEIIGTFNMLDRLGVKPSNIVRPPYGKLNESIKGQVKSPFVLWNIDTGGKNDSKENIKSKIKNNIMPGSIIKLHETGETTLEALEELIPELISEGYSFVTIDEMNKRYANNLVPGKVYAKLKEVA